MNNGDPKVTLTQKNTNKTFDSYFYTSGGTKLTVSDNTLGTLGFKANGNDQSLSFTIKGKIPPDIMTKNSFIGTVNYRITKNKDTNYVN